MSCKYDSNTKIPSTCINSVTNFDFFFSFTYKIQILIFRITNKYINYLRQFLVIPFFSIFFSLLICLISNVLNSFAINFKYWQHYALCQRLLEQQKNQKHQEKLSITKTWQLRRNFNTKWNINGYKYMNFIQISYMYVDGTVLRGYDSCVWILKQMSAMRHPCNAFILYRNVDVKKNI